MTTIYVPGGWTKDMAEPAKVSIANQKGGVGKTLSTVQIAGALNQRGHDVLVVDSDPQGSATIHLGYNDYFEDLDLEVSFKDVLTDTDHLEDIDETIADIGEFDLVRSNITMNAGLRTLLATASMGDQRLSDALSNVDENYDFVLVDTPPSLDKIAVNSAVYSQNLLVPTYPERMSTSGLSILSKHLVQGLQHQLPVSYVGFLVNRIQPNSSASDIVNKLDEEFGGNFPVWRVRDHVALQRSIDPGHGSIFTHDEFDEAQLTYLDIAAWLEEDFGKESSVSVTDILSEDEIRESTVYGNVNTEHLNQIGDEVEQIIQR